MSRLAAEPAPRITGLGASALAADVMLLTRYCLGISVNLYSTLERTSEQPRRSW
jgi:hypothetical protein